MLKKLFFIAKRFHAMQKVSVGFARAAAARAMQRIDPLDPYTWEISGLSQNGEDGISDYLTQAIISPNKHFLEIGASDGTENNTSWFAIARRWCGTMVEGSSRKADFCRFFLESFSIGIQVVNLFVSLENISDFYHSLQTHEPDFFSIDIDGVDWHIVHALLNMGFRPKIVAVEYNSSFGPEKAVTIPYVANFEVRTAHPTSLYFGSSIQAWRKLLERFGYQFITVESSGTNAFFVRPECFKDGMFTEIKRREFQENFFQKFRFKCNWEQRYAMISHLPLEMLQRE